MDEWDDLRFYLAVARHGSLSAAAGRLGVRHSTVSRRLSAFEERLGVRLFDRLPDGMALTRAGHDMLEAAQAIEASFAGLERRLMDGDARPSGPLRVTAPEMLVARVLLPRLGEFNRRYPEIEVALIASDEALSLHRREADIAIRATARPPTTLVGRKLCGHAATLYGSREYLDAALPNARRSSSEPALAWIGRANEVNVPDWVELHLPGARLACRVDSKPATLAAVKAGLGVAPLPCRIGDIDAELRRVPGVAPWSELDIWLLTHPDLRQNARVKAFRSYALEVFLAEKDLFEGRVVSPAAVRTGARAA